MVQMIGKQFGRLTVVSLDRTTQNGKRYWLCECECGNTKVVEGYKLRSGNTMSCGCLQNEVRGTYRKSHGMTNTKLYTIWQNMKHRCNDSKNIMYKNYGGRGIRVCEEWMSGFEPFMEWAFDNGYVEGLSIERVDVNGNYEPCNCKWITKKEQYLNRTDSHKITAFGKTQTLKEWSDEVGIKFDTLERRINKYGWEPEKALTVKPWGRK